MPPMRFLSVVLFSLATLAGGAVLAWQLLGDDQRVFQPGTLSYAHHQLELACASCHDDAFSGNAAIEQRCLGCHQADMKAIGDAHGPKKFADPRNAGELQVLDASRCLSCHREHVPEQTLAMQVTQPKDFCMACHGDIASVRPSHQTVAGDSCTHSGCHNYHDNSTLYEAFLSAHLHEPALLEHPQKRPRHVAIAPALTADWSSLWSQPDDLAAIESAEQAWTQSAHAKGHANCSDCHRSDNPKDVPITVCADCHEDEWQALQKGHHGMRLAAGLAPMTVAEAKLPMHADAADNALTCNSCHAPHRYDTVTAAAERCLGCHADEHSNSWLQSAHGQRWQQDPATGVSCAGCHMPREPHPDNSSQWVQHNQSANLRPNDKMLKQVCMRCHGLEFALSALADRALIDRNFTGPASGRHDSMEWLRQQAGRNAAPAITPAAEQRQQ